MAAEQLKNHRYNYSLNIMLRNTKDLAVNTSKTSSSNKHKQQQHATEQ